ncbi:manganese-dependent inorganic pyrophosphatase [Atopobacter sp. AH10]|uniref:manganese-dependent inorganic pyrophosphatase n=1 Tax=Atopobacter sp. AH10 TaxID=2315861 RepID=UPI000EF223FD|nr:manganese-dependent inorganic pyrophosphatase [Atopobacter sp. AH10]RLK63717.1 manganese-dependent inorganic pyrophosphatase [Atopobacter sp. AH10]
MTKIKVFGHRNPDTDAISSAIIFAHYLNEQGKDAEAVALGAPNEETQYALDYFKFDAPRIVETLANEDCEVALTDHNERQQSIEDIDQLTVRYVIDHHRIANFETDEPLYYRAEPVGCTCTILYKMYKEAGIDIPQNIAGLMASAICSDSLLFKSPTCTHEDVDAAKACAEIAGIDIKKYGLDMLKAGTNVKSKTAAQLVNADAKTFDMGEHKVRVGQVNCVDLNELKSRKAELVDEMTKQNEENGFESFLLMLTNILTKETALLVVGGLHPEIEKAFEHTIEDDFMSLPGVVSRKKQIIPPLSKQF